MDIQLITYGGRVAAAASARRLILAEHLERRSADDPERTFVLFMCAYAADVANGILPGPYNDQDARLYARACLIPMELLERERLDYHAASRGLRVPVAEIRRAHRATQIRRGYSDRLRHHHAL